jgi:hypothetical protein
MTAISQHLPFTERHLVTPLLRVLAGRLGLDIDGIRVLEVRGRRSGTWHRTPVKVVPTPASATWCPCTAPRTGSATSASTPRHGCG